MFEARPFMDDGTSLVWLNEGRRVKVNQPQRRHPATNIQHDNTRKFGLSRFDLQSLSKSV
jgi:hypothetical protein